jgi:energy-coupling factor transporter transmembrane protein EcfT
MEIIILCAFILLMFNTGAIYNIGTILIFSCFIVVEASAGLSILTLISRSHGNDFILIF